jgi:hypothetical protein
MNLSRFWIYAVLIGSILFSGSSFFSSTHAASLKSETPSASMDEGDRKFACWTKDNRHIYIGRPNACQSCEFGPDELSMCKICCNWWGHPNDEEVISCMQNQCKPPRKSATQAQPAQVPGGGGGMNSASP